MKRYDLVILCLAGTVIGISSTVVTGYILGIHELYTVPVGGIGMALPTSLCLLIISIAVILLERRENDVIRKAYELLRETSIKEKALLDRISSLEQSTGKRKP